jgi:hypothetical protein
VGPQLRRDHYHTDLIRTSLTRNLAVLSPDICDELVMAFNDMIPVANGYFRYRCLAYSPADSGT